MDVLLFQRFGDRAPQAAVLHARFHAVILSRSYSEGAAQRILEHYFDKYMQDVAEFSRMLTRYENNEVD